MKGYRTYVCSFLGAVIVLAMALGYISDGLGLTLLGLMGFGSIAALRAAIDNAVEAALD